MDYILWDLSTLRIDQTPQFDFDTDTDKINLSWLGKGNEYLNIPLLYCESGCPVFEVNNWLIHLKANRRLKKVNTQAQALLHYYIFLRDIEMTWDTMPHALRNRPTYQFKKHLKDAVISGKIAGTTATSYMNYVIKFYMFYLVKGYVFDNAPFKYELVKVQLKGKHESMRNSHIVVNTTDLRLRLPKQTTTIGASRKLISLSDEEWSAVDTIYRVNGVAIRNVSGIGQRVTVAIETKLMIALARFTGMRRQELVTFRSCMVFKPSDAQLNKKYLVDREGILIAPELGVDTKGSGSRTIEIPSALMFTLHRYINSKRYVRRRTKFKLRYKGESEIPPLFITQTGTYYSGGTLDARWGEIRNATKNIEKQFDHKFHNLRATYAVSRIKELLNASLNEADALDYIQATMGHKHRATLFAYLKQCKVGPIANGIYENALEKIVDEQYFSLVEDD